MGHYEYPEGVSGNYKQTIFPPDAPEWQQCRKMLEDSVPNIMQALGLKMSQLPLLWAADFMPLTTTRPPLSSANSIAPVSASLASSMHVVPISPTPRIPRLARSSATRSARGRYRCSARGDLHESLSCSFDDSWR